MQIFETERLTLRYFEMDDAPFVYDLLNSPDWINYVGNHGIKTLEDAQDYLFKKLLKRYRNNEYGLWLVALKEHNLPIGMCGLIKHEEWLTAEISFALLPDFKGKGYALEAADATLAYGFNIVGLRRLFAISASDNFAAIKLLEKIGFKYEKKLKNTVDDGEWLQYGY